MICSPGIRTEILAACRQVVDEVESVVLDPAADLTPTERFWLTALARAVVTEAARVTGLDVMVPRPTPAIADR